METFSRRPARFVKASPKCRKRVAGFVDDILPDHLPFGNQNDVLIPPVSIISTARTSQSNAHAASDKILGMDDRKHSEQIERMLDVVLCMPKSAWGLVLEKVEKKIGAAALRRIILRAYEESDLKRGVAMLDREKKRTEQRAKRKTGSAAAP